MSWAVFKRGLLGTNDARIIDAKTLGSYKIDSVEDGYLGWVAVMAGVFGAVIVNLTTAATVSIGTNDPDYDNILAPYQITEVAEGGQTRLFPFTTPILVTGDPYLKVTVAAVADACYLKAAVDPVMVP